jgi:hypothetical protein
MSHVSADKSEEARPPHPGMRKRHSSFLSDLSGELVDVPVQRTYVFGSSKGSLQPAHSQLGALEEKGDGLAELNLLSEAEPDHRTGEPAREGGGGPGARAGALRYTPWCSGAGLPPPQAPTSPLSDTSSPLSSAPAVSALPSEAAVAWLGSGVLSLCPPPPRSA